MRRWKVWLAFSGMAGTANAFLAGSTAWKALLRHAEGKLTAAEASAAKLWHTETQWQIVDAALQLPDNAHRQAMVLLASQLLARRT